MRRLARWLLNILAILSLSLSIASLLFWGHSYFRADTVSWAARDTRLPILRKLLVIRSDNGSFDIERSTMTVKPGHTASLATLHWAHSNPEPGWHWQTNRPWHSAGVPRQLIIFWFHVHYQQSIPPVMEAKFYLSLPYWVPFLSFALLPATRWLLQNRSRRRQLAIGKCKKCGYNLTSNISGTCPECGTAIAPTENPARPVT